MGVENITPHENSLIMSLSPTWSLEERMLSRLNFGFVGGSESATVHMPSSTLEARRGGQQPRAITSSAPERS